MKHLWDAAHQILIQSNGELVMNGGTAQSTKYILLCKRFPACLPVVLCIAFCIALLCTSPLYAKKKNKKIETPEEQPEVSNAIEGDKGTVINIKVPQTQRRTYFSDVNAGVVNAIEIGSPATIGAAASSLKTSEQTEPVQVLLYIADAIMKMVWKSESVSWKMPPQTPPNTPYTGAIESAKSGVYDTSTGNTDFLTYVLPSLVIANSTSRSSANYFEQSERSLKQGLALCPDSVLAKYLLSLLYIRQERYTEALPLLQAANTSAPECKEILFALCTAFSRLGKKEEASRLSAALLSRWPQDKDVLSLCAENAYALKDYNSAEQYAARLLQQDPNNSAFILFRAKMLVELGDYIRATSMLDIYARQDTSARDYLLLRAKVQRDWSGNLGAALATCEDALRRYPKDAEVLLLAASLASAMGSSVGGRSAASLADEALALNPNSSEAVRYKINALVEAGEWQQAYKESAWYMKDAAHASERDAIFTHIRICLQVKRNEEAWNLVSPLYRESPSDESVLRAYLPVLAATGRRSEALALINKELGNATASMRSFYYYQRSLMQGTQEAALADLRSALIALPRNKDALFRLYQIYYEERDYRKAQYYLKQVIALDRGNASMRRLDEELQRLVR